MEYVIILGVILFGWMITILDQPIYIIFEGRRYWPSFLRSFFLFRQRKRLKRNREKADQLRDIYTSQTGDERADNYQKYIEAWVEIRRFPMNDDGEYIALFPSRLGNLIASFEGYPELRYGMEAIFYWYRIWLIIGKDLREELDTRQAAADSAIYASFSLLINALLWLIYASVLTAGGTFIGHLYTPTASWALSIFFLLAAYLAYRVAVYPQAQYGETLKSLFDVYHKEINISEVIDMVADAAADPSIRILKRRDQLDIAWRYLHNYRIKCTDSACKLLKPMSPSELKKHIREVHAKGKASTPPADNRQSEYYSLIALADKFDYYRITAKFIDTICVAMALALGIILQHYGIFLAVVAVGLSSWAFETVLANRQGRHIQKLQEIEDATGKGHIYKRTTVPHFFRLGVFWLHAIWVLSGIILFLIGLAGILGTRF